MKLIISDTHYHKFNTFSKTLPSGLNSRLHEIIEATKEAVEFAVDNDCDEVIHTGDCFHVRGSISPTVLNPVLDLYRWIIEEKGLKVTMIAGNHDLESRHSEELSNTAAALKSVGVEVVTGYLVRSDAVFISWFPTKDELFSQIKSIEGKSKDKTLYLHAPLNEVISGIPDNGIDAKDLETLGYQKVFCGHYHNHKNFNDKVVSVGSLTHQNFGDIHSTAGFVLYNEKTGEIQQHQTSAPKFVDTRHIDPDKFEEAVDGNYVRCRLEEATDEEILEMQVALESMGAKGYIVSRDRNPKTSATARKSSVSKSSVTIQMSVQDWVKAKSYSTEIEAAVIAESLKILEQIDEVH